MRQLGLNIQLKDWAIFDSYLSGDNQDVVTYLKRLFDENDSVAWLWGPKAVGKTHLLQAACACFDPRGSVYIPCNAGSGIEPKVLSGLAELGLVCLDDIQAIAGDSDWELAIFGLFNELQDQGGRLLIASESPPSKLQFEMADLSSRLSWGPVFRIKSLTDDQRTQALALRAQMRGFELPEETSNFLLRRYSRDTGRLFELLDRLDVASLAAQRRLTIPFVKSVL